MAFPFPRITRRVLLAPTDDRLVSHFVKRDILKIFFDVTSHSVLVSVLGQDLRRRPIDLISLAVSPKSDAALEGLLRRNCPFIKKGGGSTIPTAIIRALQRSEAIMVLQL